MVYSEVGDADLWPSTVPAVGLSAQSTVVVHAQLAQPFSLGTGHLIFDHSNDESDDEGEGVLEILWHFRGFERQ